VTQIQRRQGSTCLSITINTITINTITTTKKSIDHKLLQLTTEQSTHG
jgi:hypothetical protein